MAAAVAGKEDLARVRVAEDHGADRVEIALELEFFQVRLEGSVGIEQQRAVSPAFGGEVEEQLNVRKAQVQVVAAVAAEGVIAALAAVDEETAQRALDLIEIEFAPLPAYFTSQDARAAEETRDKSLELNKGFAGALTFLQIAILMVSLAGLVKQIWFWYAGLIVGAVGVFQFAAMMMQTF